jgi:predicted PurR-regulated permease PerM
MTNVFNFRLRQIMLLSIIVILFVALLTQLSDFLPGVLGAITTYILTRKLYQKLVEQKKWKKGLTRMLFIIGSLIIIAIPIYLSIRLVSPKINALLNNQEQVMQNVQLFSDKVKDYTGLQLLTPENTKTVAVKISAFIPRLLNSTVNILSNLIILFFLYYYLLASGSVIEKFLNKIIPLKTENVKSLGDETIMMIRANAIGIPVICLVQGVCAAIGYLDFWYTGLGHVGICNWRICFFPFGGHHDHLGAAGDISICRRQ